MPDDGDDSLRHGRNTGRKPPANPAPHLRPQGFLRDQGDACGRKSGPIPAPSHQSAPPRQLSEKDLKAEGEREKLRHLQAQGRLIVDKEHKAKLQKSREAFDEQHHDEILALQKERQAIIDRRSGGILRAQWHQFSGRAAHDDALLEKLDQQARDLEAMREKQLAPLQADQREELNGLLEVQQYDRDFLEDRIQREIYGDTGRSGTDDQQRSGQEAGRDDRDSGRER